MMWNLFWVTLGNTIAGSVFMAGAYWLASKKPAASLAPRVEPAE
jgi:formate/nitrite transporter FocA (FNT family)